MRPIDRKEILPLDEYERIREHFRGRVIEEKKIRRVMLGDHLSAVFENRDTVFLQIQEMLRTERITTEAAILHELETYNALVPKDNELKITLFVEIADKELRDRMLTELAGLEDKIFIEIAGARFSAEGHREGAEATRTTAVHYLTVKLDAQAAEVVRRGKGPAALGVVHPKYEVCAVLKPGLLQKLAEDELG